MVSRYLFLLEVFEVNDFTSNHFRGGHIFDIVHLEGSMFSCSESGYTVNLVFVLSALSIGERLVDNTSSAIPLDR